MGQHNFLDDSNFTIITILPRDLVAGKNECATGFIVHMRGSSSNEEGSILLFSNYNFLSKQPTWFSLNFHEQRPCVQSYEAPKKFSFDFNIKDTPITAHPNREIDLSCLDISSVVSNKFIKGVNPFFYFDEELNKKSPVPLSFKGDFCFHSSNDLVVNKTNLIADYGKDGAAIAWKFKESFSCLLGSPTIISCDEKAKFGFLACESATGNAGFTIEAKDVRELIRVAGHATEKQMPRQTDFSVAGLSGDFSSKPTKSTPFYLCS